MRVEQHLKGNRTPVSLVAGLFALYLASFLLTAPSFSWGNAGFAVCLAVVLIWVTAHDIKTFEIPDAASVCLLLLAVSSLSLSQPSKLGAHLLAGLALCALLWALGEVYFRRQDQEGLGIGDAKLFGAGAVLLGPAKIPDLLLLASIGGICGYLIYHRLGLSRNKGIAFGPFIAYAIFILFPLDPVFT